MIFTDDFHCPRFTATNVGGIIADISSGGLILVGHVRVSVGSKRYGVLLKLGTGVGVVAILVMDQIFGTN